MPELTAVQFMTENLQLWCAETPIMSITVLRPAKGGRYALHGIPTPFIPSSIYRRGKHTVLANEEGALIVSYNLSGKIFRVPKEESAPAFRIRFDLGSHHLIFSDRIGLGRLTWLPPKVMQHTALCNGFKQRTGRRALASTSLGKLVETTM